MKHTYRIAISLVPLLCALVQGFAAEEEKGWNPDTKFPPLSPADAIKTFEIPTGYRLECIASEPMVEEPASFTFDGNGALYVCEWRTYMQDEFATKQLDPVSRIVKLVDTNGDGIMDKRTVFIDNVVLPRTVLPLHDRVLVQFTGSNSVWAYFDDNKDGVADRRELVFDGGPNDGNIEHQNSGMLWNLDNTICTNDQIASVTKRPEMVAGTHYFVPANVMKLFEVVNATKTAPATVHTARRRFIWVLSVRPAIRTSRAATSER